MSTWISQPKGMSCKSPKVNQIPKQIISSNNQHQQHQNKSRVTVSKSSSELKQGKVLLMQADKQKKDLTKKLAFLSKAISKIKKAQKGTSLHVSSPVLQPSLQQNKMSNLSLSQKKKIWKNLIVCHQKEEQTKIKMMKQEIKSSIQKIKNERKDRKKRQIMQRMQLIEQRIKKRDIQIKQGNQKYEKLKKVLSMHQKMNKDYQQKQMIFFEQNKKKLQEIHHLKKSINQQQLKQHENKLMELKKQKQLIKTKNKQTDLRNNPQDHKPVYKSIFYKRIRQTRKADERSEKIIRYKKIKQFSSYIKQTFIPEISSKKQQQILAYINNEKNKNQQKMELSQQCCSRSKSLGLEYLNALRNCNKKIRKQSMIQLPKNQKVYRNYICGKNRHCSSQKYWKEILNSTADNESKGIRLKMLSQKKQMQLKRKEQQSRLISKDIVSQIDDEYFRMMKAKLDFLQSQL